MFLIAGISLLSKIFIMSVTMICTIYTAILRILMTTSHMESFGIALVYVLYV